MIPKPIEVKALYPFTIWIKYKDETEGLVDLSDLAKNKLFANWHNPDFFNKVYIDSETFSIAWDENTDLCPMTMYLRIKGLTFEAWNKLEMEHATN